MSKFVLEAVQVQVITTADGKEFHTMEEAVAHQNILDAAELIAVPVEAYLNSHKMIDRNRKQKRTVVDSFAAFLVTAGVDLSGVEAVERTVQDTPAPAKVEVEEAPVAETAETAETTEEAPVAGSAESEDDLF